MDTKALRNFIIDNNLNVINNTSELEIRIQYKNSTILKVQASSFGDADVNILKEVEKKLFEVKENEKLIIANFRKNLDNFKGEIFPKKSTYIIVAWEDYAATEIRVSSDIVNKIREDDISLYTFIKLIENKVNNPNSDDIFTILDYIKKINEEVEKINKAYKGFKLSEEIFSAKTL